MTSIKTFQKLVPTKHNNSSNGKCVVPENIYTPLQRVSGNSEGEGALKTKFFKGIYEPKLEFPQRWGFKP